MKRLVAIFLFLPALAYGQTITPPPGLPISGGDMTGLLALSVTRTITAAGSTSGSAYQITTQTNEVTTVASGTGVRLPAADPGTTILVVNRGANTLNVYPNSGAIINGGSANVPVTLAAGSAAHYTNVGPFTWYSN